MQGIGGYSRRLAGFTLIEAIIVLAIVSILLGIGVVRLQPASARLFANDVASQMQQARFEALKQNRPVSVVWLSGAGRFETRMHPSSTNPALACDGSTVMNTKRVDDYRNVTVTTDLDRGIVWLPNGQARTCSGGPNAQSTSTIEDGRVTRSVHVTTAGRVSVQ